MDHGQWCDTAVALSKLQSGDGRATKEKPPRVVSQTKNTCYLAERFRLRIEGCNLLMKWVRLALCLVALVIFFSDTRAYGIYSVEFESHSALDFFWVTNDFRKQPLSDCLATNIMIWQLRIQSTFLALFHWWRCNVLDQAHLGWYLYCYPPIKVSWILWDMHAHVEHGNYVGCNSKHCRSGLWKLIWILTGYPGYGFSYSSMFWLLRYLPQSSPSSSSQLDCQVWTNEVTWHYFAKPHVVLNCLGHWWLRLVILV